jgi:hypothetical protein
VLAVNINREGDSVNVVPEYTGPIADSLGQGLGLAAVKPEPVLAEVIGVDHKEYIDGHM